MIRTVALTGGIGSGKSALARYLSSKGVCVYDSDSRTKALYDSNDALRRSVEDLFGTSFTAVDGSFDRRKLAGLVFSSPAELSKLESVVHPAVLEDFLEWRREVEAVPWQGYAEVPFVVIESAIILSREVFRGSFDRSVEVVSPLSMRISRTISRDGTSREAVLGRIAAQQEERFCVPDAVIDNSGTLSELYGKADEVFTHLFD